VKWWHVLTTFLTTATVAVLFFPVLGKFSAQVRGSLTHTAVKLVVCLFLGCVAYISMVFVWLFLWMFWYGWAIQKWLNQLRCHLVADLCGSKEPCIWGPDRSREGPFLKWRLSACCNEYIAQCALFACRHRRMCLPSVCSGRMYVPPWLVTRQRCGPMWPFVKLLLTLV